MCGPMGHIMVATGQQAPDFTAPIVHGNYEGDEFTLADTIRVDNFSLEDVLGDGPIVLAFFPGTYTPVCKDEMSEFSNYSEEFQEHGAQIFGISVDIPFTQNQFADQYGIDFPLLSDSNEEIIEKYDVVDEDQSSLEEFGYQYEGPLQIAQRSVFVLDENGEITYRWVSDAQTDLPNFDEVMEEVRKVPNQ
jgi:peroxiredoxin